MKLQEHSFLSRPEWQSLLVESPSWPFHSSQAQSLTLKTQLHVILLDAPSLIIDCGAMNLRDQFQNGWQERLNVLMIKVASKFDELENWLVIEAGPLFFDQVTSQELSQEQEHYTDLICAVVDSVCNTALLILDNLFRGLSSLKLQSTNSSGDDTPQWLERMVLFRDLEDSEYRRRRMLRAFHSVQRESTLAARPLRFGLQQFQPSIPAV